MKRPPGRPPLDETSRTPSADVHLTLPATDYDTADRIARSRRESIQDLIRRGLKRLITDESGGNLET